VVVRPHGHWYHGYGHYSNDDSAWKWLAFTAITLKVLDNLNESQQRKHEAAQVEATTAAVGQPVAWQEGSASGSVTTTSESQNSAGEYCREFQQEITVGGETEQAYGTACQQPDGAWKIVSD
jgi:surface antigen